VKAILLLASCLLLLSGCDSQIPDLDGVEYEVRLFTDCPGAGGFGSWRAGYYDKDLVWHKPYICYDGTDLVKAHENCHELKHRAGFDLMSNKLACGDRL